MKPLVYRVPRFRPHGLTWACALSIAAHAGVLWLWWPHARANSDSRWSRQKGAIQVSLRPQTTATQEVAVADVMRRPADEPARVMTTRPVERVAPRPQPVAKAEPPARHADISPIESQTPAALQDAPAKTGEAPPPSPTPQVATEAADRREGSPFRNLFAPLSSRSFGGQASWRPRTAPTGLHAAETRDIQAMQMLQAQWDQTLQRMQHTFTEQAAQGTCTVQVKLQARQVSVQCTDDVDQKRVQAMLPAWPTVPPALSPPPTSDQQAFCWRLHGTTIAPSACTVPQGNENGSPQAAVVLPTR